MFEFTAAKNMFGLSEVFHFRKYNAQLQPADVTVMLLICVQQWPSSIESKDDVIPT